MSTQDNWRICKKCNCLFFAGESTNVNRCAAHGEHDGTGSADYMLTTKTDD